MDDAFANKWRGRVADVELRRKDYFAALDKDEAASREAARQFWGAVGLMMACYNQPKNWPSGHPVDATTIGVVPRFAIPPALARIVGTQAMYLYAGQVPSMFARVVGRGRTGTGPHELRDMIVAVAYVASLRAGENGGVSAPIKTTADAYGISTRALQKWIKEMPWVSKNDFGSPKKLRAQFDKSAQNYRAAGRSVSAVVARAKTRARY